MKPVLRVALLTLFLILPRLAAADAAEDMERWRALSGEAASLAETGDASPALVATQRALAFARKYLPDCHACVTTSLIHVARVYARFGQEPQAEGLLERRLEELEADPGPDDPALHPILDELATFYFDRQRYTEADRALERAAGLLERAFGPDHLDIANLLGRRALIAIRRDDDAAAAPLVQRALAIGETNLGADHPGVINNRNLLGIIYTRLGRHGEAEPLLTRALAAREAALGAEHAGLVETLEALERVYRATDRAALAGELRRRIESIR